MSGGVAVRHISTIVRAGTALALVSVLAGCWPAPAQGPDRGAYNPFEDGITPDTVTTLAPVWTATTDGVAEGRSRVGTPVVSNGGVHVSDGGGIYGFDRATGARLWRYPETALPASFGDAVADPVAEGGRLLFSAGVQVGYSGSWTGESTWLDARTGAVGDTVADGPVIALRGSRLVHWSAVGSDFFGFYAYYLHVVDMADRGASWSMMLRTHPSAAPPPTLGGQRLYVAGDAATSYEPPAESVGVRAYPLTPPAVCVTPPPSPWPYSPISCPLWTTPTAAAPVTSPVLAPGESTLYVGTADGTLLALDTSDGRELWRAALGAAPSADPALAEGWLYVPLADGDLSVLHAGGCGEPTCRPAWRSELGSAAVQPAVAGGVVYVGTSGGRALAFAAAGCGHHRCRPLWQRDLDGAVTGAPAVTGGRLYLGVAPDELVAFAPA